MCSMRFVYARYGSAVSRGDREIGGYSSLPLPPVKSRMPMENPLVSKINVLRHFKEVAILIMWRLRQLGYQMCFTHVY